MPLRSPREDCLWSLPPQLFPEGRLIWSGSPPWAGRRVALLSSRIGSAGAAFSVWLDHLGCLLPQLASARRLVLTCPGTTCHRYLAAVQQDLGFPLVQLGISPQDQTAEEWLAKLVRNAASRGPTPLSEWLVSPPLAERRQRQALSHLPLADRLLAALGEDVYVLFVRRGGNLTQLVTQHLAGSRVAPQRWTLAMAPKLVPPALAEAWLSRGAIAWHLNIAPRISDDQTQNRPPAGLDSAPRAARMAVKDVLRGEYLTHWTRRQSGPWPDQTERQYRCNILLDPSTRDRSALDSLMRILEMRRLIATNRLTRAAERVVSFTARPVNEFAKCRVFRPMHARWDFEPYGLCIDRRWLQGRGARPVIYGDESTWRRLAAVDRPFFQPFGQVRAGCPDGEWTGEQEWRCVGDLDLRHLPRNHAVVFVPNVPSAVRLADWCPWPIAVIQ